MRKAFRAALDPAPEKTRTARRTVVDLGLWLVTALPFGVDPAGQGAPAVVLGLVVTAYVVVIGRRQPSTALAVAAATALIDWRYLFALAVSGHLAGTRMSSPRAALVVFPAVAVSGTVAVLVLGHDLYDWAVPVAGLVVFGLVPWLSGRYRGQRAALVRAGWERAARLEERQRIVAEQARLRERARIAHDMHDFLGHHLSLAALHAGALEIDPELAERHAAKAGELRASIATATEQLGEITRVLRDESDPLPFAPAGEDVRALVERTAAAGVDVSLEVLVDLDAVEPMRLRAAYRVVQEALTNAAKHAPGAPVLVRLATRPDALEVRVVNGPPTSAPADDRVRGGRGLAGLRERARLLGGRLDAGPVADGFGVTALLPLEPQATTAPAAEPSSVQRDFHRATTEVRRSLLIAVLGPVAVGGLLVLALMGLYAYDTFTSVLTPQEFERLSLGDARAALAIPEREVPERGDGPPPAEPPGSRCAFYRSAAGFLPSDFDVYRLCFRDGRLVAKDVLSR
ncbi:sensor histidine kinase [Saccharothrix saharensis]|uniref:sensor histidine kinase n=1 Tax=Saccharothrix saharensis TaxID=571190 RepID=UPI0036B10CC7